MIEIDWNELQENCMQSFCHYVDAIVKKVIKEAKQAESKPKLTLIIGGKSCQK